MSSESPIIKQEQSLQGPTQAQAVTQVPLNIKIAQEQELFFFSEYSPGSCFWLPNGTIIYNKLMDFIKDEYFKRGFKEVKTPIIGKKSLWSISGHWEQYRENMFFFDSKEGSKMRELEEQKDKEQEIKEEIEKEEEIEDDTVFGVKAMGCPLHCLMFKHKPRSYRELPIKLADFGPLHRNELSGALTSLFRVRQFSQDDAHIFCRKDQMKNEIKDALEFLKTVYTRFGFDKGLSIGLSTRPDKYVGDIKLWNEAECILTEVLNESGMKWFTKQKDGAFYGPKIDFQLTDSLQRKHQCGTIQLDFQLPLKFDLTYQDKEMKDQKPIIIHRAIYGSFERFIAILCEHYNGKWPFWLNPRQIRIIPIHAKGDEEKTQKILDYARSVQDRLRQHTLLVEVDDSDERLKKKIRLGQTDQCNYILVVGQQEMDSDSVNVRYRDSEEKLFIPTQEFIDSILKQ